MAVDDALALADRILQDPLKADILSIFSCFSSSGPTLTLGSRLLIAGEVDLISGDTMMVGPFPLKPGVGFDREGLSNSKIAVKVPSLAGRSISLSKGVHVLCAGNTSCIQQGFIQYDEDVVVTFRPDFDKHMPWNLFHCFSGAYSGWAQATSFLDRTESAFCLGQEFELDIDEQVMQLWSVKHAARPFTCPVHWSTEWPSQKHVGLHGSVADWTPANVLRVQSNLCLSMSPPCQSWSKGGKHLGLADRNGWAFIDAVQLAVVLQPVCIVAECSDEIVEHEHFRFVELLFQSAGYRLVWKQVTPLHHMAHHCRTRWLAAWCRFDVNAQFVGFSFPLRHSPRCPWDDPSNHVVIPGVWRPQLCLTESECAVYDNPDLLPRSGRVHRGTMPTRAHQVLWERVPASDQPLPTLCASYSSQHLLAVHHVQLRGLFTFLKRTARGFEFFDPGHFCLLFGTQTHVVLPTKVPEAFRIVGNAISVPQAVLALGVVMHSVGQVEIDPLHLVRKSWLERFRSHNSIMFEHQGFVHLIRATQAPEWISFDSQPMTPSKHDVKCLGNIDQSQFCFSAAAEVIAHDFLLKHIHGPQELVMQMYFRAEDMQSSMTMPIGLLAAKAHEWEIVLASTVLGRCTLSHHRTTEVIEISPTIPFEAEQHVVIRPAPQFDCIVQSQWFCTLSDLCKGLVPTYNAALATCVILQEDSDFHFQCWGSVEEVQSVAATIQSQIGGRIFDSSGIHSGGKHCTHLVIHPSSVPVRVVYIVDCGEFHLVQVDTDGLPNIKFQRCDVALRPCDPQQLQSWPDDQVMSLTTMPEIRAGGHHQAAGPPPRLAQGADFNARAEFMCNTNGWLATDEMCAMTQTIQWSQQTHHFAPPVLWDPSKPDFEDDGTEVHIYNNSTTVLPILVQDHWAACEIHRQGDNARVVMVQMPQHLVTRATFIMARILDIGPHRIEVQTEMTGHIPHLCGWTLLQRWFQQLHLMDEIADVSRQYNLPDQYVQTIEMCMQCSIEDWTSNGMPHNMGYLAVRLRKNFLWFLARRQSIGQPVPQQQLVVGIPEPPHREIVMVRQDPPSLPERIAARLQVFSQHPGWATSDEIDYTLEILRFYEPNTLFCPPAVWEHSTGELRFLNGFQPTYQSYRHVVWFVASQNHWIIIELCCYDAFTQLILTIPPV